MKNITIVVLVLAALALGALAYRQADQAARNRTELLQVQNQLAAAQDQLKSASETAETITNTQRTTKALQQTLVKTYQYANEKEKQTEQLQQELAAAKTNSSNPMSGMAQMFKDPKMREMIKSSQKAMMGPMIEKQYGALFKQLQMTPDDNAQLKTLLMNKMLAGADSGMSMMDDSLDATQRADLAKQIKDQSDDYDAQVKQLLGDNYPSFQSYEKTLPDRTVISQFSDQLSGDMAMTPDQSAQMIQAMTDARTGFKWTTDYSDQKSLGTDYSSMFTEDKLNQFTQEKEQFDQQFLAQAQKILSPQQLTEFQQFQEQQRQMQIMGMKMAAQMFGPKNK